MVNAQRIVDKGSKGLKFKDQRILKIKDQSIFYQGLKNLKPRTEGYLVRDLRMLDLESKYVRSWIKLYKIVRFRIKKFLNLELKDLRSKSKDL